MSMLSSQCDTLRVAADALEDEGVMPACAELLRDAADTIWRLRNDCVELRDEKENLTRLLREALEKKFSDEDDLRAENERLWRALAESCCRLSAANEATSGGFIDDTYCELLRELGIDLME